MEPTEWFKWDGKIGGPTDPCARPPTVEELLEMVEKRKDERGFASMDPAKQREIASKGGRAAHEKGTAHEFSPEEAREAGRKGGEAVSRDRKHMAEIGSKGGHSSGSKRQASAGDKPPKK